MKRVPHRSLPNGMDFPHPARFLTNDEERALGRVMADKQRPHAERVEARNRIVINMMPLAINVAKRFSAASGKSFEDMLQFALLRCLNSWRNFNPQAGLLPKTYFGAVVIRSMQLFCKTDGTVVRPQNRNTVNQLKADSEFLHLRSLNAAARGDDADTALYSITPDPSSPCPVNALLDAEEPARVDRLLGRLGFRVGEIVRQRVVEGRKLREVGERFGISREAVRQIVIAAMRKLRTHLEAVA